MDSEIKDSYGQTNQYSVISYILAIIAVEIIVYSAFINFLLSQGINYRIFLIFLPVLLFLHLGRTRRLRA